MRAKHCLSLFLLAIGLALALGNDTTQPGTRAAALPAENRPLISGQPAKQPPGPMLNMANPAAVYCTDLGYEYQIITAESGAQSGICIMPDQTTCEEWDFLTGKCGQKYSYCAKQGYGIRVATLVLHCYS